MTRAIHGRSSYRSHDRESNLDQELQEEQRSRRTVNHTHFGQSSPALAHLFTHKNERLCKCLRSLNRWLVRQSKKRQMFAVSAASFEGTWTIGDHLHSKFRHFRQHSLHHIRRDMRREATFDKRFSFFSLRLVVRLDQRHDASSWAQPTNSDWDRMSLSGPRHIEHDDVDSFRRDGRIKHIGSFANIHARIIAKFPIEHAITRIHGDDFRCASLQQAICKTPSIAAEIRAFEPRDIDLKRGERMGHFDSSSRDIFHNITLFVSSASFHHFHFIIYEIDTPSRAIPSRSATSIMRGFSSMMTRPAPSTSILPPAPASLSSVGTPTVGTSARMSCES